MADKPLIWICSLQYNPVHQLHCCGLGRQAELYGFDVMYLFSQANDWILPDEVKTKTVFMGNSVDIGSAIADSTRPKIRSQIKKLFNEAPPDFIYIWNVHPFLNHYIASQAKKNGCTFIQHIHEPYVEDKRVYGILRQYMLTGLEYLQERLLNVSDVAIVSSEQSRQLFKKRYPDFKGKLKVIPLLYRDLGDVSVTTKKRRFITFIGPPAPAKGTAVFLDIVRYANERDYSFEFRLISRKKIEDKIFFKYPNLQILYKEKISDEEMGQYIGESLMTITPYLAATQSSVILTSFMFGTPVISSNVGGLPEFIEHQKTGYLLDPAAPAEEWIEGMKYIMERLDEMCRDCRDTFIRNYTEENWPDYFETLFRSSGRDK